MEGFSLRGVMGDTGLTHDLDIVLKQEVEGCQSSLPELACYGELRSVGARCAIHGSTHVPASLWGFGGRGEGAQDDRYPGEALAVLRFLHDIL